MEAKKRKKATVAAKPKKSSTKSRGQPTGCQPREVISEPESADSIAAQPWQLDEVFKCAFCQKSTIYPDRLFAKIAKKQINSKKAVRPKKAFL
jgi:hypothetical protein